MKKIFVSTIILLLLTSCGNPPNPIMIEIVPKTGCEVGVGEEIPLSLRIQNAPANATYTWTATEGEIIVASPPSLSAKYIAPSQSGDVNITAILEADGSQYSANLTCRIVDSNDTPAITIEIPTETPTEPPPGKPTDIVITEVMAVPCGDEEDEKTDEFIELYNSGDSAIDVNGWWIITSFGGKGTPDKIVSWKTRNSGISLGSNVLPDTTIIEPGQYAVILSQSYYLGTHPYLFPPKTVVLTVAEGVRLGNDARGIKGSTIPIDTVVLYLGSSSSIDSVVSTYGTPIYGANPDSVTDDSRDRIPLQVDSCYSVERLSPSIPDAENSWARKKSGSPGRGH